MGQPSPARYLPKRRSTMSRPAVHRQAGRMASLCPGKDWLRGKRRRPSSRGREKRRSRATKKFACVLTSFPSAGVDLVYPATPVRIGSKRNDSFFPNPVRAKQILQVWSSVLWRCSQRPSGPSTDQPRGVARSQGPWLQCFHFRNTSPRFFQKSIHRKRLCD